MKDDELQKLWGNPAHWNAVGRYHCDQDPRLIVSKRFGVGWTLNWANPFAWPVLVAVIAVAAGLVYFSRLF